MSDLYHKQIELHEAAARRESLSALSLAISSPRYDYTAPPPASSGLSRRLRHLSRAQQPSGCRHVGMGAYTGPMAIQGKCISDTRAADPQAAGT